jgi:hypothetical protein
MDKVRLLVDDEYICALWVSGEVGDISKIVEWVGGFIVPQVGDQIPKWTVMYSLPVGNTDGDIFVILCDIMYDLESNGYWTIINRKMYAWGIEFTEVPVE